MNTRDPQTRKEVGRRYFIRGRVHGVGFRDFVQRRASELGVKGYVRNLDDGRVEAYAVGTGGQLSDLAGWLHQGPRWADVRGVEEQEAPVLQCRGFEIRY